MKIKKLMRTTALTVLLSTSTVTLASCGSEKDISYQDVIEYVADETNMDEIENIHNVYYIDILDEEKSGKYMPLKEAREKLEKDIKIYELLESADFDNQHFKELDLETKKEVRDMLFEQAGFLYSYVNSVDVNVQEEAEINQKLAFLKDYVVEDIMTNGLQVSSELVKTTDKAIITDALDLPAKNYKNITLEKLDESTPDLIPLFYTDDNGYQKYYELWNENCYEYVYEIQEYMSNIANGKYEKDFYCIYITSKKAIEYSKEAIASGSKLKGNKIKKKTNAKKVYKEIRK